MKNVMAIQEKKWPLTKKKLMSLIGLSNYYRPFIRVFPKVARTLFNLIKKGLSQRLDEICHKAFGELKSKLSLPHVLKFLKFHNPCEVHTEAWSLPLMGVDARWM